MRLRNKKTGEVTEIDDSFSTFWGLIEKSLPTLEWEDYEEPKRYWYIDADGNAMTCSRDDRYDAEAKAIGNYFETKEDAEKAVEKLKAWKRLKDKGFHLNGWDNTIGDDYYKPGQIVISLNGNPDWDEYESIDDIKDELNLLFGGEEMKEGDDE